MWLGVLLVFLWLGFAQLVFTERTYEARSKLLGFLMGLLGLEVTRRPSAAVFLRMKVAAVLSLLVTAFFLFKFLFR